MTAILFMGVILVTLSLQGNAAPLCRNVLLHDLAEKRISDLWRAGYSPNTAAELVTGQVHKVEESLGVDRRLREASEGGLASTAENNTAFHFREVDLMKDTDIIIFFPSDYAKEIARRGYLNVHQVKNKNNQVLTSSILRRQLENLATGLKLGNSSLSDRLRPKSGFLNVRGNSDIGDREGGNLDRYGDAIMVLKNDVKKRSLWSSFDFLYNVAAATDVGKAGRIDLNPLAGVIPKLLWFLPYFRPKEIEQSELLNYVGTFNRHGLSEVSRPSVPREVRYFETLVLGDVTFQNDVSHFLVDNVEVAEKLKPYGRPIYQKVRINRFKRDIYIAGPQVDPVDVDTDNLRWTTQFLNQVGLSVKPTRVSEAKELLPEVYYHNVVTEQGGYRMYFTTNSYRYHDWMSGKLSAYLNLSGSVVERVIPEKTYYSPDLAQRLALRERRWHAHELVELPDTGTNPFAVVKLIDGEIPVSDVPVQQRNSLAPKLMELLKFHYAFKLDTLIGPENIGIAPDGKLIYDSGANIPYHDYIFRNLTPAQSKAYLQTYWSNYFSPAVLEGMLNEMDSWPVNGYRSTFEEQERLFQSLLTIK